jgi:16S rRNA G966 N2-methylase RsmD
VGGGGMKAEVEINIRFGSVTAYFYMAGYTFQRGSTDLKWLLVKKRWMKAGSGFKSVNKFLDTIQLGSLRGAAEERKELAQFIVQAEPKARKTQIAKTVGVHRDTIGRDLGAANAASTKGKRGVGAANAAPTPSGKAAATRTAHEEIAKFAFNQAAQNVPKGDPIRFGDFRELSAELKDNTVDLIFTDPPYNDESLPLYGQMGEVAKRILKPGASLVTYCGHMQMLKAAAALEKHLRFWQPLCCLHATPPYARLTEFGVIAKFKPMLWFVKGTRADKHTFIDNVVSGQREKDLHEWQQSEAEAAYFIENLTGPAGFVVDFFAGSGTTIVAAGRLGRSVIGYEISAKHHAVAMERVIGAAA